MKYTSIKLSWVLWQMFRIQCFGYSKHEHGQMVNNRLFPAPVYLQRPFDGQYCHRPISTLSLLLIKIFFIARAMVKRKDFTKKGQQCFYFPQKTSIWKAELWKNQPINPAWCKPSSPTQSILWVWPSSWRDAWSSVAEPQYPQVPAGLHVWIWGQIVHLSAVNFFKLFMNLNPSLCILLQIECISSFHHILVYRYFVGKKLPLLAFLSCRTSVLCWQLFFTTGFKCELNFI